VQNAVQARYIARWNLCAAAHLGSGRDGGEQHPNQKEQSMARIELIAGKSDVAPEHEQVVDRIVRTFGGVVGPSTVLLHVPKMAIPIYDLGDYFRNESVVPARLRLLGILVAARERHGAFVWGAQIGAARRAGVTEATIDLLRAHAEPARFSPEEGEVVAYATELMRTNRVSQETFDALKNRHGVQWLIELTTAVCYYAMLSGIVSAFEVPAESEPLPR
jgi:4-carboxymuconolactone decarboxylase